jgi:uncharacterized protein
MPDLWSLQFGLVILATFAASAVSTSVGFGFGIILVSFLQFFVDPVQIVGLGIIVNIASNLFRVMETRKIRAVGVGLRVTVSGLAGVPIGVALLWFADPLFLKRYFSIAILVSALLLILLWRSQLMTRRGGGFRRTGQVLAGALGGFMCGSANLGGPPVVFCGLVQHWEKMTTHAVFARYFLATTVASAIGLMLCGLFDRTTVLTGLGLIPVVWAGFLVGTTLRAWIPEQRFRQYLMVLLTVLAVVGLLNTYGLTSGRL